MEGGTVEEGGGGPALWLPLGNVAGAPGGLGTEGRTRGNQQQWGEECITLTICTKGLT